MYNSRAAGLVVFSMSIGFVDCCTGHCAFIDRLCRRVAHGWELQSSIVGTPADQRELRPWWTKMWQSFTR